MAANRAAATPGRARGAVPQQPATRWLIAGALRFHRLCASKRCRRLRRCAGIDVPCFDVFWPHVPERSRVALRAMIAAAAAGGTRADLEAERQRAVAKFDANHAGPQRAAREAAVPVRAASKPLRIREL